LGGGKVRSAALDQAADFHVRMRVGKSTPGEEAFAEGLVAGRQKRVHDDQPLEAAAHVHRQRETDEATPILTDEGDPFEVKRLDKGDKAIAMELERIGRVVCGLVGAAESEEVGRHCTAAAGDENRDHFAIEIDPAWLAVKAKEDVRGILRALV